MYALILPPATGFFSRDNLQWVVFAFLLGIHVNVSAQIAGPAPTTAETHELAIEEKPLADALRELAIATGTQIVFSSDVVLGKNAPSLSGTLTVEQALQQLLVDSNLEVRFISPKSAIIREKKIQVAAAKPAALPTPEPTELEVVLVTGSRVARSEFDQPFPTKSIGPLFIERGSYTTVGDAIHALPSMCEPRYSLNSSDTTGNIGETFSDLFCLGSQRTLTLINGRRTISSNEPSVANSEPGLQVDLNMIPRILIRNIEVIGVGSAPVYGSDAVAGTVNILLKDRHEGLVVDLQHGVSALGDGEQDVAALLYGHNFAQDTANLTFAYEFHQQRPIPALNRLATQIETDYVPAALSAGSPDIQEAIFALDVVNPLLTFSGIPTPSGDGPPNLALGGNAFLLDDRRALTFDSDGRLTVFDRGDFTGDLNRRIGGDGIREPLFRDLRTESQRHVSALNFHADIRSGLSVFLELQGYEGRAISFEPIGSVVPVQANDSFVSLPLDLRFPFGEQPFLHPEDLQLLRSLDPNINRLYLHKDWREVIDPRVNSQASIYRGALGIQGENEFLERTWSWDLIFSGGRAKSNTKRTRVNPSNFNRATQTARIDDDGNLTCGDQCIPFNPLGRSANPDALAYISDVVGETGNVRQRVFTASAQGPVLDLAGGEWIFVVGAEARSEFGDFKQDEFSEPRLPGENVAELNKFRGSFDTRELFFESVAPIVGSHWLPGLEKIELDLNWRGVRHSAAGTDSTWSVGTRWSFAHDFHALVLRGNRTQSIRAPSLFELFRPFTPVDSELRDPCDRSTVDSGPTPEIRLESCLNEAVARNFVYDAETFVSQVPDFAPISVGGTPTLKNESATSTTFGFVYQYDYTPELQLSADLVDIAIEDAIEERDLNRLASQCYDSQISTVCDDLVRDSRTFQLIRVRNLYENIGKIQLRAIQYNARLDFPENKRALLPGRFSLDLNAYQLIEFTETLRSQTISQEGKLRYPEWRWYASLSYTTDLIEATWSTHFTDAVQVPLDFISDDADLPYVEQYWLHHLAVNVNLTQELSARFGVRNVFDTEPPDGLPSREVGATYDAVGRYFSIGIALQF